MTLYTLLMTLFLFPNYDALEQEAKVDLSGHWSGVITQATDDEEISYDIALYLEDKDGKITGTSITSRNEIHATIDVEGTFESGLSLMLKDTEIKDNVVRKDVQMEWCLKNYILLLKKENDEEILEGHWHGKTSFMDCRPGRVVLKRGVDRA